MVKFKTIITKIANVMQAIGLTILLINVALVVINVIIRVCGGGLTGTNDWVSMLAVCVTMLCMSTNELRGGHCCVDFIVGYMPQKVQKICYAISGFVYIATLGLVSYTFFKYAATAIKQNLCSMTALIPFYPFILLCAVCFCVFTLAAITRWLDKLVNWEDN